MAFRDVCDVKRHRRGLPGTLIKYCNTADTYTTVMYNTILCHSTSIITLCSSNSSSNLLQVFQRLVHARLLCTNLHFRRAWSHLVMDEAHALKNRHSIRAIKMRKVAGHCKARVMLTGASYPQQLLEGTAQCRFRTADGLKQVNSGPDMSVGYFPSSPSQPPQTNCEGGSKSAKNGVPPLHFSSVSLHKNISQVTMYTHALCLDFD